MIPPFLTLLSILVAQAGDLRGQSHPGPLIVTPVPTAVGIEVPRDSEAASQDPILDTVRSEMARGRFWHAALLLRSALPEAHQRSPGSFLLLAEAEAGWGNWAEVTALLQAPLAAGGMPDARPWYLLARSLEEGGRWQEAEAAYGQVLVTPDTGGSFLHLEARLRRGIVRGRLGRFPEALSDVGESVPADPALGGWVALELAEMAAAEGARRETRSLLALVSDRDVRELGWSLPARAALASGDSIGAEAAYWVAIPFLSSASDRAAAWEHVGVLRLARGDSMGARGAFHRVLELSSGGDGAAAAQALLRLGFDSLGVALAGAEALARDGRHREALQAYGAHERLSGGAPLSSGVLLGRARSHASLREWSLLLALVAEVEDLEDPGQAAPALALRVQGLRGMGRVAEARSAEDLLVARFPQRPESVEVLFLRAEAQRGQGDLQGALRGFRAAAELAPAQNLAGEARMRMGQLLLGMGEENEGLEVFSEYLRMFPDGRRWDEAAFWAGRTLLSLGRVEEGEDLLRLLVGRLPISYYSVQAGLLLGQAFAPEFGPYQESLDLPPLLRTGLERIDRLLSMGLRRRAEWEASRTVGALRLEAGTDARQAGLLRLALELNERGFTREGINLGWELRRDGLQWNRHLLSAIYPFPHREMVVAEAEERGLDPFLMAGLIRQESAFWVEARSSADARGLMQVLPSTGAELARTVGPRDFRADDHLYRAEINLHLGMAFFADLRRRFGDDLPILLSAYNAGPSRARRWQEFPEAKDLPRFVERIPFNETKGYVKAVLLNREIYRWLGGWIGTVSQDPGVGLERDS